jgi:hypothetical protein
VVLCRAAIGRVLPPAHSDKNPYRASRRGGARSQTCPFSSGLGRRAPCCCCTRTPRLHGAHASYALETAGEGAGGGRLPPAGVTTLTRSGAEGFAPPRAPPRGLVERVGVRCTIGLGSPMICMAAARTGAAPPEPATGAASSDPATMDVGIGELERYAALIPKRALRSTSCMHGRIEYTDTRLSALSSRAAGAVGGERGPTAGRGIVARWCAWRKDGIGTYEGALRTAGMLWPGTLVLAASAVRAASPSAESRRPPPPPSVLLLLPSAARGEPGCIA